MALNGDRVVGRGAPITVSALLRALLILAVLLVPVLTCPQASDATTGTAGGTAAVSTHIAEIPHVLAAAVDGGNHHECRTPPVTAAIAAVGSAPHGWVIALAMLSFVALALWVAWSPRKRGPPRQRPHWLLSSGRDHLLRFCVMRR